MPDREVVSCRVSRQELSVLREAFPRANVSEIVRVAIRRLAESVSADFIEAKTKELRDQLAALSKLGDDIKAHGIALTADQRQALNVRKRFIQTSFDPPTPEQNRSWLRAKGFTEAQIAACEELLRA